MKDAKLPNEPNRSPLTHPVSEQHAVDDVLRAAATRQRRALASASDATTPRPTPRRHAMPDRSPMPMPNRRLRGRHAFAAAAVLALCVGGWWVLNVNPAPPPSNGPVASDLPSPDLPPFFTSGNVTNPLAGLSADGITQPLADEFDRMQADVRRVLAHLPRVSLRWETPTDGEPRTDRDPTNRTPSA